MLSELPLELIGEVAGHLDNVSLIALSSTCSSYRHTLLKELVQRHTKIERYSAKSSRNVPINLRPHSYSITITDDSDDPTNFTSPRQALIHNRSADEIDIAGLDLPSTIEHIHIYGDVQRNVICGQTPTKLNRLKTVELIDVDVETVHNVLRAEGRGIEILYLERIYSSSTDSSDLDLSAVPNLRRLTVQRPSPTDVSLNLNPNHILRMKNLQELFVRSASICTRLLPVTDQLRSLTSLSMIVRNREHISPLGALTDLSYLHLNFHFSEWIKDDDLAPLQRLSNLRSLNLSHGVGRLGDLSSLLQSMSGLRSLTLRGLKVPCDLSPLASLRDLRLRPVINWRITRPPPEIYIDTLLSATSSLEVVALPTNRLDLPSALLEKVRGVRSLELDLYRINQLSSIGDSFASLQQLEEVTIVRNGVRLNASGPTSRDQWLHFLRMNQLELPNTLKEIRFRELSHHSRRQDEVVTMDEINSWIQPVEEKRGVIERREESVCHSIVLLLVTLFICLMMAKGLNLLVSSVWERLTEVT